MGVSNLKVGDKIRLLKPSAMGICKRKAGDVVVVRRVGLNAFACDEYGYHVDWLGDGYIEVVRDKELEECETTSTFEEGEEWKTESYGTTFFESEDSATRKQYPIYSGVLKYFPDAIAAVSNCSWMGSKQHHPDEDMHWERDKSTDHEDCLLRHLLQKGTIDTDGVRHSTKVAWRALAILQLELEGNDG